MISVGLSERVVARRGRVWAALTDPAELVAWRPGRLQSRSNGTPYPQAGATVRWRCRVRRLPLELRETPLELRPGELLRSRLALGPFRFEATFALSPAERADATRVGLRITTANQLPLLGGVLDRFAVRGLATQLAHQHLRALVAWCERGEAGAELDLPLPSSGEID